MSAIAAIGVGGTNFQYAAGTTAGELLTDVTVEPTECGAIVEQILRAVRELRTRTTRELTAVSIACKGLVDSDAGTIEKLYVPGDEPRYDIDLRGPVRREFGLPTHVQNDCTASVLGEYYYGEGTGYDTVVYVTIGTGIGGGVVDHGRLLEGESGYAAEIGGIQVGPREHSPVVGLPGSWEAYCSGPGIGDYVRRRLADADRETALSDAEDLTAQTLFEAADRGDPVAEEYLAQLDRYNAAGFGTVCNVYDPGLVVVGGGVVVNNPERVLAGVEEHIEEFLVVDRPAFSVTDLGEYAGVYGALAHGKHREAIHGSVAAGAPKGSDAARE